MCLSMRIFIYSCFLANILSSIFVYDAVSSGNLALIWDPLCGPVGGWCCGCGGVSF